MHLSSTILRDFSKKIIKRRYERKLTQEQLSELLDIHVNTINRIERAVVIPKLDVVLRISYTLDISIDELIQEARKYARD